MKVELIDEKSFIVHGDAAKIKNAFRLLESVADVLHNGHRQLKIRVSEINARAKANISTAKFDEDSRKLYGGYRQLLEKYTPGEALKRLRKVYHLDDVDARLHVQHGRKLARLKRNEEIIAELKRTGGKGVRKLAKAYGISASTVGGVFSDYRKSQKVA